ncbi:hypothetical protein Hanom_Chr06g00505161 [Helianthus anomalus]
MHASKDSFLQSSVRQRSFLSLLFRFGCVWLTKIQNFKIKNRLISVRRSLI